MAELLIAQSEYDQAFEWMRQAIEVDPQARGIMRTSSDYDAIRDDVRFRELIEEQTAKSEEQS